MLWADLRTPETVLRTAHQASCLPAVRVNPVTVLEDNTAILDVERIMEVTPASGVTSDGSDNPSLRLRLLWKVGVVARVVVVTSVVRVSSSSYSSDRDAQWWCKGRVQRGHRRASPHRLYLLLKRGRRALLLQLLSSTLLLLVQAAVQPIQMARLTSHRMVKRALRESRRQERNDWLPCGVSKTSHLQKTP
jgi:hypothetical protein